MTNLKIEVALVAIKVERCDNLGRAETIRARGVKWDRREVSAFPSVVTV
jgi:hypothetical protein